MNFKNISFILAILLVSILAIGSVSASEDISVSDVDTDVMVVDAIDDKDVSSLGESSLKSVSDDKDVSSLGESSVITVNDSNKNNYFTDDGLTEEVSEGDTLNFEGEFSDFTFNVNKNNIVISGLEGNKLTNCVIKADSIEGFTISNLNFEINNIRNAISLTSPVNTQILNNNIIVNYDEDFYPENIYSLESIIIWAGGENILISGNNIVMESSQSSMYIYAIDLVDCSEDYMAGGNHFSYVISDNIVNVYSKNTCPYALYLAGVTGSEDNPFIVKNNLFNILTDSSYSDAYGIAISGDSWIATEPSEYIFIENNTMTVSGNNMVYGIEAYAANNLKFVNNEINAYSTAGAYCIGVARVDTLEISNNILDVKGGDYSVVSTYDYVGAGLAAIYAGSSSSVGTEKNTFVVNEDNYNLYFEDGKLNDKVNDGDCIIFNMELLNEDLTIDKSIVFDGNGIGAIKNGTLYVAGENIQISNLIIDNINKNAIFVRAGSENIAISNNKINIEGLNAGAWDTFMGICTAGGVENIHIEFNEISILGDAPYNYAIDISDCDPVTYSSASYNPCNISIISNNIVMDVTGLAEAIYTSIACDSIVKGNIINISATGSADAYAIAASTAWGAGLVDASNVIVSNNDIQIFGNNMVYGIELFGDNLDINNNEINLKSNGGAYAIAVGSANTVNIKNNVISVNGVKSDLVSGDVIGVGIGGVILSKVNNANIISNIIEVVSKDNSSKGVKGGDSNNVSVKSNYIVADSKKGNDAVDVEEATISDNTPINSSIVASGFTKYYGDSKKLAVTLKDVDGKVLANKKVTITIKGKTYSATTNSKGQASFAISNTKGSYSVTIKFAGDNTYSSSNKKITVKVVTPIIKAISTKVKKGKYLQISFKTSNNKAIKKTKVTIKIKGKTYTLKTNSKGIAKLKLKLRKKTYSVKVAFKSTSVYGKTTKTFKVKVR